MRLNLYNNKVSKTKSDDLYPEEEIRRFADKELRDMDYKQQLNKCQNELANGQIEEYRIDKQDEQIIIYDNFEIRKGLFIPKF
jgi:antitoxin component YwqK of YwqJK toxin-antitoxin module